MLAFDAATDLHRQAMTWAEGILRLKIPEEELKELEKRKEAAAVIAAQTRLRDGSLQEAHLQTLVELVSDITRSQWQLLGQYQHNVFVQCKHIPSAKNVQPTETFQEPQNTEKHGSRRTTARKKRKATGVSGQNEAQKLAPTHFSYPTKDHIILPSRESGGRGSSSRVGSPEIVDDAPIPRPGNLYLVRCRGSEYIPAVVLFPGSAKGLLSVENTDLLSFEKCCSYDQQKNVLSCRDTPGICVPVKLFDREYPERGDAEWVAAVKFKPLHSTTTLPTPYDKRVSEYLQKYAHYVNGAGEENYLARQNSVGGSERQTKVPRHKLEDKIPCSETAPSKVTNDWDDDPMAIARLI